MPLKEFETDYHLSPIRESWPEPNTSSQPESGSVGGSNWIGLVVGGFMFIVMGIVIGSSEPDMTPFPGIVILAGVVILLIAPFARRSEIEANIQRDVRLEEERAEQERLREEEKEDIVRAVKSTIKVRCRYCGTLNEESAAKCESCGGVL